MNDIRFPPLMTGIAVGADSDPFENACAHAMQGCDPGLVFHRITRERLSAAIVFTPEMPLREATSLLPTCGIGFQNALGALAPPEVAVHLDWDGGIRLNGASCGQLAIATSTRDIEAEPDWMVVGLDLQLRTRSDSPGNTPGRTALYEEGCAEVEPERLLESWTKHTLVWINRWPDDGLKPLHAAWRGLAHKLGEQVTVLGQSGRFIGIDENFGMLLETGEATELLPLTSLLRYPE